MIITTINFRLLFFVLAILVPLTPSHAENISTQIVSIYSFNKDKAMIPGRSLVLRAGIPGVFIAHQNQARFRMVHAGKTQNAFTTILAGLKHGDKVIQDSSTLFDGQNIEIQQ